MDASEFWSIGDYSIVGELWSAPGRELADSLEVADCDVIDLATGTGVTAIAMARRGARSVVGVDAAAKLLAEAARRADAAGVEVNWIVGDVCSVPLPDRSADLVVSTFGLIFAGDPAAAIAECRRLTRHDGRVVFTSWSGQGLFGRIRQALSPYFPDEPEPWHETTAGIRAAIGDQTQTIERSFVLDVASAEVFVSQLETHSAPFILAAESLGQQWEQAREALVEVVLAAGDSNAGSYRAEVSYLVTTVAAA